VAYDGGVKEVCLSCECMCCLASYHLILINITCHAAGKDDGKNFYETNHHGHHGYYDNASLQVIDDLRSTTLCVEVMINEWH